MKKASYLILIPLGIGLIVALFEFVLPKILRERAELSYKVDDPISYIDPQKIQNLDIKINGKDASYLFANQIILENSGALPITGLPVSIIFETTDSLFQIFNYSHSTVPKYEFGNIEHNSNKNSVRFTFKLLNPSDQVFINVLTNKSITPTVYAKSEGMKLYQATIEDGQSLSMFSPMNSASKLGAVFAIIVSLISTIVAYLSSQKSLRLKGRAEVMENAIKGLKSKELKIVSAIYGKGTNVIDLTNVLNDRILDNRLSEIANNNLAGDPCPGEAKELKLLYNFGQKTSAVVFQEHEKIELP